MHVSCASQLVQASWSCVRCIRPRNPVVWASYARKEKWYHCYVAKESAHIVFEWRRSCCKSGDRLRRLQRCPVVLCHSLPTTITAQHPAEHTWMHSHLTTKPIMIIIIIIIRQLIRRRNMSMNVKSLQGRRTPGSRDECSTAPDCRRPLDQAHRLEPLACLTYGTCTRFYEHYIV